ncbi:MAG TPA: DNA polymerase I [Polyangia bacterium]|nr:DNA polymerase I [Polyangia bacterium]
MSASPSTTAKPTLYILDALNFLFRAFHALPPLTTRKGIPTGAIYGLCQMLLKIERENRPTHFCVVFDAPGENFRNKIFPAYKAHRPPMPPELATQVALVHTVMGAFGITTLSVPNFEADDVIATVSRLAVEAQMDVVICSSDKDLMQLCSESVAMLDTMKNRRLGPAEVQEKFGVPPDKVGDVLALMGDGIDNVPGVEGIGPKTASELINRFGSLTELLNRVGEVKGKRGEALAASRELVLTSRELVRLRDDVVLPKTLTELHRVDPDRAQLRELFTELEFTRLLDSLNTGGAQTQTLTTSLKTEPRPAATGEPDLFSKTGSTATATATSTATATTPDTQTPTSPPGPVVAAPPVVALPPPRPARVILERQALQHLAAEIAQAGAVGLAALYDGPSAVNADLVGLALALPDGTRAYLPLCHRYLGVPACLPEADALAVLGTVLGDPAVRKHGHDIKTVEVLLHRRGITLGGLTSDSMIAAYLLDASRTRYDLEVIAAGDGSGGAGDVQSRPTWLGTGRTLRRGGDVPVEEAARYLAAEAGAALALAAPQSQLLATARLGDLYTQMELPLSHVLAKIECRGIRLDVDYLRSLGNEVSTSLLALEKEIHAIAGGPFNINSNKQLADVLFGKLGLPVVRKTKTGASTDADTLEELAALHPVPAKIVEYRMLAKLKGTYIDALPALVDPKTARLHTSFNQAVAATGRLSSSDPNLQNIPIRTEVGRRIRKAFLAKPGFVVVSADYSQIELRILAHFSEDPAFLDAFRSGQDIHLRTAAEVFQIPPGSVTSEHRRIAKAINFGLVFGQSDYGLSQVLRIPRAQAREYIDSYFRRYAGVRAYMERAIAEARTTGEVGTLLGRRRPLPEIHAARAQDRSYAERIARNTPIQGSAADLLKLAMIKVEAGIEAPGSPVTEAALLLTVHDELVFEVPEGQVETFRPWIKNVMETIYPLKVPLVVDVGAGLTWGDAHGG